MKFLKKFFISFFSIILFFILYKNISLSTPINNHKFLEEPIRLYFINEKEEFLHGNSLVDLPHIICNKNLLTDLHYKYKFFDSWNKRIGNNFSSYDYNIKFWDFNIDTSTAKVHVIRDLTSSLNSTDKFSSFNEEYLFLLKYDNGYWKIDNLVFKEENENTFYKLKHNNLSLRSFLGYKSKWKNNFNNIDNMYNKYCKLKQSSQSQSDSASKKRSSTPSNYSVEKTIDYALNHALSYNSKYKNFDGTGGDCTNFISQCLHAGGLPLTKTWRPYNDSWINVNLLRNYLIYNSLASEYTYISDDIIGDTVQFYNTELKRYSHSGIITKKLTNGDFGYCAHSYDKLNYPLSLSYPTIYNKIRILKITY